MNQNQQQLSRSQKLNLVLVDKQNRSYFVGAVSFMFFLVFIIFGLIPAFKNVLSANAENKIVKTAIKDITVRRNTLLAMKNEREQKQTVISMLEDAIPNRNNQGRIVEILYKLSGYSDTEEIDALPIVISQLNFQDQVKAGNASVQIQYKVGPNVKSKQVSIIAEGTLPKIREFLLNIEKGTTIMNIKRSIINRKTGEVLNQSVNGRDYVLNLTIEYFYWGLPNEI